MTIEQEMQAALATFLLESHELLQTMEEDLLVLEQLQDPTESIAAIFRAAHTIKGSAGLFGLGAIVRFTHVVESVLESLRAGKIYVSSDLIANLLPCRDHIAYLVQTVADGYSLPDVGQDTHGDELLARLQPFLNEQTAASSPASPKENLTNRRSSDKLQNALWHISLRCGIDSLKNGLDPLALIRHLQTMGSISHITTLTDALPEVAAMDPESSYLGFEIDLQTTAGKEAIEEVFEFIRNDSIVHILPPHSRLNDYIELIRRLPENPRRLGEILVNSGLLTQRELEAGLQEQSTSKRPLGAILVDQQLVPETLINAALTKQRQAKAPKNRDSQSIRVDAEKLDKLIDLVGELVIASAGASSRASKIQDRLLLESNTQIMGLVELVRDSTLKLRMVQIGLAFNRFQRIVRDTSTELGKEIDLQISGGDTEVDKSMIEQISDPLMHLVRNAIDHGIESPSVRSAKGKPIQGTLKLKARHESSSIVIEVSDDGGGLNRDKIVSKAIERGIIQTGQILSDKEIFALIFEPGFSTADKVSNISGRGVGMDVVKQNINALRGEIEINSIAGEGTTMKIRLPLTLAIINGFQICVGQTFFVIPQERILECVELPSRNKFYDYMALRGEVLPFIRLHTIFNIKRDAPKRENVVVVEVAGKKIGLVVDHLMGEFQTVIKPLGKLFQHVHGISGSTILGSGAVALIIDVPALVEFHAQCEQSVQMAALNYA